MNNPVETEQARRSRLRWVTLGEAIAVAALMISAVGLWLDWRGKDEPTPSAPVVEKQKTIPLVLLGRPENDGRRVDIAPVEDGHALESLVVSIANSDETIELGSDGRLSADAIEDALGKSAEDGDGIHSAPVRITARYIEAGDERTATGNYLLKYEWTGGGLFGGRSLRITGFSRR